MTTNATLRILVACEADVKFAVSIRPRKKTERGAAPLKSEFDMECGFWKAGWPGYPHPSDEAAKSLIPPL